MLLLSSVRLTVITSLLYTYDIVKKYDARLSERTIRCLLLEAVSQMWPRTGGCGSWNSRCALWV